ncbi:hypothetical protein QBC37DRAFT_376859 [Rhypophila decipiens]|uniref:Uncharacterized protein n=1 Tax=Rhypophila decipiens TaxID=261697 RepID=A0AAN6Y216_9PEZI|nr:hypothetical protein QBC37DRAFT_376859 [Rhypophila decipiens]
MASKQPFSTGNMANDSSVSQSTFHGFKFVSTPLEFLTTIWPYRHILWITPMLLFLAPRFYNTLKSTAFSRAYHMPYPILALHVFISFVDLVKYHTQVFLANGSVHSASRMDLILCVIQCWTSLYITAQHHLLPKIAMEVTRATFHCMSVQRLFATAMAIHTGHPQWHEASIMLLNNFIWARVLIGSRMGRFSWKQRYGVGIVGSHLLGMWNGSYPHGIAIYCGLMFVLLNIDGWAKRRDNFEARALRYLGFATPVEWYIKMGIDPPSKEEKRE